MLRIVVPLALGAVAGAVILLTFGSAGDNPGAGNGGSRSVIEAVARFTSGRDAAAGADRISVSSRRDAYRSVADESDLAELQRALGSAQSRPDSLERDLAIEAALGRIAEMAPAFAVEIALALGLEQRFVVEAFVLLADADAEPAIVALGRVSDPRTRQEAALAIVESLGNGFAARDRVAAGLPEADRNGLLMAALLRLAEYDPYGALREAQRFPDETLIRQLSGDIGRAWVHDDPVAAMLQADLLPDTLAQTYLSAVHDEWARVDTDGYASYLESLSRPTDEMSTGLRYVMLVDPERALRLAQSMTGTAGQLMESQAWAAIAFVDPAAAQSRFGSLPPGQLRDRIASGVASGLARRDPDAALAWAQSLDPPVTSALRSVISSMARTDPVRVLDLMNHPSLTMDASLILSIVTSELVQDPARTREFASLLVARDDTQSKTALQGVVAGWMQQEPEAALRWVLANDVSIDGNLLASAAQTMARTDPATAAAFVTRLPDRHREAWITQVAAQYARADADAALTWVRQFEGQPYFAVVMRDVISNAARSDPRAAAQAMAGASAEIQFGAAQTVASTWAQVDPRAAADWALELSDARSRETAVTGVVSAWAQNDFAAARGWMMRLPNGPVRDRAIAGLVGRSLVGAAEFDWDLVRSIGDDTLREQAASMGLALMAQTNPARAAELLESEIKDPEMRARVGEQIELARQQASAGTNPGLATGR